MEQPLLWRKSVPGEKAKGLDAIRIQPFFEIGALPKGQRAG
jgi:hypothetical protein